jgi:hypothetical protein
MGREIKRVPLDFDWPTKEVWSGFLMPESLHETKCGVCDGTGYSGYARHMQNRWYGYINFDPSETGSARLTPDTSAVRAFAERNVERAPDYYGSGEFAIRREAARLCRLWNGMWSHHLDQADVDALVEGGRLYDFTHTWVKGDGWQPKSTVPTVTAEQVNLWSLQGFGHDAINCWVVIRAKCERDGKPHECDSCNGHGSHEAYPGQRAEAEAWEPTDPPAGEGWQLWETTSEGSPVSPVFAEPTALAEWMSRNDCGFAGSTPSYETALAWVTSDGWAPSMAASPETGVVDGITFMAGQQA